MPWQSHWEWWQLVLPAPEPPPKPEPSTWALEKAVNRLSKTVQRVESGRLIPRFGALLVERCGDELRSAKALIDETAQAIRGG